MDKKTKDSRFRHTTAYQAALAFLFDRIDFERVQKMPYSKRDLNISRMRRLLELLDNPHDQLKIIHVAGTKGKGSTTAFLSTAFTAAGMRCGSYTSPHLRHVEERFRINGDPCSPESLVALISQLRPAVEAMDQSYDGGGPTYFEICTAIAFQLFVNEKVDVVVLEVGLGGRLDSTNVCFPVVSVITNISFDHVKQLGNTLRKIATEKAGIIKPKVAVVSGAIAPEAKLAIEEVASQNDSPLWQLGVDFDYQYLPPRESELGRANFTPLSSELSLASGIDDVPLGLLGEHQAVNACVAWATVQALPPELRPSERAIREGFAATRCAARIEVVAHAPKVIVDTSHNVASAQALVDVLQTVYPNRRRILLLGATTGKDVAGILRVLLPEFDETICTQYENNPRAFEAEALFELAQNVANELTRPLPGQIQGEPNSRTAWSYAESLAGPKDLICVTGSFFIAAEIKELVLTTRA